MEEQLDEDEKKALSEVGPISGPTYNDGKAVYILESGHMKINFMLSYKGPALRPVFRILLKQFSFYKDSLPKRFKMSDVIEMKRGPAWGHIFAISPGHCQINDRIYQKNSYCYIC